SVSTIRSHSVAREVRHATFYRVMRRTGIRSMRLFTQSERGSHLTLPWSKADSNLRSRFGTLRIGTLFCRLRDTSPTSLPPNGASGNAEDPAPRECEALIGTSM